MDDMLKNKIAYALLFFIREYCDCDPIKIERFIDLSSQHFKSALTIEQIIETVEYVNEDEYDFLVYDIHEFDTEVSLNSSVSFTCMNENLVTMMKHYEEKMDDFDWIKQLKDKLRDDSIQDDVDVGSMKEYLMYYGNLKNKLAYAFLFYMYNSECETMRIGKEFIDYYSQHFKCSIDIEQVIEAVEYVNDQKYDFIESDTRIINLNSSLYFSCMYADLKNMMKYYEEKIDDLDWLKQSRYDLEKLNISLDDEDDDGGEICKIDDYDEDQIDPLEIKRDAWGNLYTDGGQMWDDYVNKNNDE